MIPKKIDWISWSILGFLALTWGGSFLLMKHALKAFHFTEIASLRIGLSAICLLPVLIARRKSIPYDRWKHALAVSLLGSTIPAFLFPLAQTNISSSLAGILNSMTPLWVLVLGALFFGVRLTWQRASGILIGLLGAIVLIVFKKSDLQHDHTNNLYGFFIVLATVLYGLSGNVIGRYMQGVSAITATCMGIVTLGIPAWTYLLGFTNVYPMITEAFSSAAPLGTDTSAASPIAVGFVCLLFLSVINTVLGSIGYVALIQRTSPVFGSLVTYIIPIFSIIFGVLDGETINAIQLGGMGLILSGVYLVNSKA